MVRKSKKISFCKDNYCQPYFTVIFKLLFIYFQVMPTHLQVIDFGGKIGILCLFVILPLNKNNYIYSLSNGFFEHENILNLRQPSMTSHYRVGCIGTDLNRNWGYHFDDKDGYDPVFEKVFQTDCACDNIFNGGKAFSAPETSNVRDFILSQAENETDSKIKFFNTNALHTLAKKVKR